MSKNKNSRAYVEDDDKPLKTIAEIRDDIGEKYKIFVKSDDYKDLLRQVKTEHPDMSEYVAFLSIFGWFREEYIAKLPKRFKKEFIDLLKDGNKEPIVCKLDKNSKGGEMLGIKAYTKEEHDKEFSYLKPAKYVNEFGEEIEPFKVEGSEYLDESNKTVFKTVDGLEQYLK